MKVTSAKMDKKALVSWSGGKDSCYAAVQARALGIVPQVLLNVLNEQGQISRSHGIPASILQAQATAMGLPVKMIASSWKDYEGNFTDALTSLKNEHQLTHAIFGDIDLDEHKHWEEKVCAGAGLIAVLPLWKMDRKNLVLHMLEEGIETIIVSCNAAMGEAYLGKLLTVDLIEVLEKAGIDPCGEGGEFHTLVLNCPLFVEPLQVAVLNKIQHDNYWFCELQLAPA